jgi:hypothetical protein
MKRPGALLHLAKANDQKRERRDPEDHNQGNSLPAHMLLLAWAWEVAN